MTPPLLYVFTGGLEARERQVAAGQAPAELNGYFALREQGLDVAGIDDTAAELRWRIPSQLYQRLYTIPRSEIGYRLDQARGVRRRLRLDPERWIFATTDSIGLPLLAAKRRGRLRNPVLFAAIGLLDRIDRGRVAPRLARRYEALLRSADAIVTYSPREAEVARTRAPEVPVTIMPFGVDGHWWRGPRDAAAVKPGTVFSVGRDPHRDFPTLDAATRRLGVETRILSRIAGAQGVSSRPGLEVVENDSLVELRDEFAHCQIVVLPISRVGSASGASSALQAMAAGKPVVFHDTGWAGYHGLRDGVHFVDVEPEDPEALAAAIDRVLAFPDGGVGMGREAAEAVRARFAPGDQAAAVLHAIDRGARV
jgi:glycosyltransferase involved in cell wall biosynthesis